MNISLIKTSLDAKVLLRNFFFFFFIRMTMRVVLAPQVEVCLTAPRLWPSPAAFNRLPPATQTCHLVSNSCGSSNGPPGKWTNIE